MVVRNYGVLKSGTGCQMSNVVGRRFWKLRSNYLLAAINDVYFLDGRSTVGSALIGLILELKLKYPLHGEFLYLRQTDIIN